MTLRYLSSSKPNINQHLCKVPVIFYCLWQAVIGKLELSHSIMCFGDGRLENKIGHCHGKDIAILSQNILVLKRCLYLESAFAQMPRGKLFPCCNTNASKYLNKPRYCSNKYLLIFPLVISYWIFQLLQTLTFSQCTVYVSMFFC